MSQLSQNPIHLGSGGTAVCEPEMTGPEWYDSYEKRHAEDMVGSRLVMQFTFSESWTVWEIHPRGEEVVLCTSGQITLIQMLSDGHEKRIPLKEGDYAINPRGVWHTADIEPGTSATCMFITTGEGTENRAR